MAFRIADYGAKGDGKADDGPAIREAIAAAVACGRPAAVVFKRRTYRVAPYPDRWCALALLDASNIRLEGNGASLLFHPRNRALLLYRCANISVRDLTITFDPLPFTQGDVVEIDREAGTFLVRLHDGYPDPPSHEWCVAAQGERMAWRHGVFLRPGQRAFTHRWVYIQAVHPVADQERVYRVTVDPAMADVLDSVAVGQRFVFRNRTADREWQDRAFVIGRGETDKGVYHSNPAGALQIRFSRNCLLENVTIHVSPEMCIRLTGSDYVTIRKCRVTYAPGTQNLVASLSDGIHCKNAKHGPFIEGCLFEGLMDDSINISTMSEDVVERLSETEFHTIYSDIVYYDTAVKAGDVVQAWDPVEARPLGEMTVASVKFLANRERIIRVEKAVEGIRDRQAVGAEACTRLYNRKESPFEVRDCVFRSQLKTAIVGRDPGTVSGCRFSDTAYGIHIHNSPRFGEGPWPQRAHIIGNEFRQVEIGAIVAVVLAGRPGGIAPLPADFLIEGNRIEADDGDGIHLTNLRGIQLRDNSVRMSPSTPQRYRAVKLVNCGALDIAGLRVTDKRPGSAAVVATKTEDVDASEIRAELGEGAQVIERE